MDTEKQTETPHTGIHACMQSCIHTPTDEDFEKLNVPREANALGFEGSRFPNPNPPNGDAATITRTRNERTQMEEGRGHPSIPQPHSTAAAEMEAR